MEHAGLLERTYEDLPISPRLEEVATQINKGEVPNAGRFCGNCYTPQRADRELCPYCGTSTTERSPVDLIPPQVLAIVKAKRRRESWIVHSFAYTGLVLGTAIAIAMLIVLPGWWKLTALVVLLFGTRGLAAILGGWLGDVLGYQSARRLVQELWSQHLAERDAERGSQEARQGHRPIDNNRRINS
ncbi:MAG TPA: zinc ribbon domain-containing protein [Dehalococcoidia bacterium]|nr:zinc ribbon domain-containing protein [Dehalococcoidia bacterium]